MSFLFEWVIKTSVVWVAALLALLVLRRKSAALRHWLLTIAILIAVPIPFAGYIFPAWHLTSTPAITKPAAVAIPASDRQSTESIKDASTAPVTAPFPDYVWFVVWAGGITISALALLVGALRLALIAASSRPLVQDPWPELAAAISSEYGLRRTPRLLQSANPSILVTWGIVKPKIVLPAGATQWDMDRARAVLSHELAHVRRGDWIVHIIAELLRAVYWFNPLIWVICRRLRIESELACDDAALTRGITAPDYAAELLNLARDLNATGRPWSALAMARPSTIQRRFEAMLNPSLNRQPITAKSMLSIGIIALSIALPIALFSSTSLLQVATGGVTGTVVDSTGAAVRSATVIVSTAAGQTEITAITNTNGRYAFTNLPAGMHVLQVFASGFGPSRIANIEVKSGQQSTQDIKMDIGFVAAQEEKPESSRPKVVANIPAAPSAPRPGTIQSGQGTVKGMVSDPSGAVVPGVEVTITGEDTGSGSRKVVTDEAGSFVLARIPTGTYRVSVALPGFKTLNYSNVAVNADNDVVTLSPKLAVAAMAEEVTITALAGSSSEPPAPETPAQCAALPPAPPPAAQPVSSQPSIPGRIRQGGFVQMAMLLGQPKPQYPAAAKMAGTQGAVIMEIVVGRDGRVGEVKVISGDPVLSAAAVSAVRLWCYKPTRLNGEPVEVVSTVSVNFVLQ